MEFEEFAARMDPGTVIDPWESCTLAERIDCCRLMLLMHGFLTMEESRTILGRQHARDFVGGLRLRKVKKPRGPTGPT